MSTIEPPRPDDDPEHQSRAGWSGMPQYPQFAHASPPPGMPSPALLPRPVHSAVQLMYIGAVLSLLSLVVSLTTMSSLKAQLRDRLGQNGQQISETVLNEGIRFAITFVIIDAVIAIALWLWMARKNGQGRAWARVVATVLGGINVIATIYSIASGSVTTIAGVITVVNLVLAIAILVLLWRKESSEFYAAQSRPPY